MTTIQILPESTNEQTLYRAICGKRQVLAPTPGQALDIIEQVLDTQDNRVIILQRFHGDRFFTQLQQEKLKKLIEQFHEAVANGKVLSPEKQQELENLVETELEASIQRSESMENQKNLPFME